MLGGLHDWVVYTQTAMSSRGSVGGRLRLWRVLLWEVLRSRVLPRACWSQTLHRPVGQPLATCGYRAFEIRLDRTEMYSKYKVHSKDIGFQRQDEKKRLTI